MTPNVPNVTALRKTSAALAYPTLPTTTTHVFATVMSTGSQLIALYTLECAILSVTRPTDVTDHLVATAMFVPIMLRLTPVETVFASMDGAVKIVEHGQVIVIYYVTAVMDQVPTTVTSVLPTPTQTTTISVTVNRTILETIVQLISDLVQTCAMVAPPIALKPVMNALTMLKGTKVNAFVDAAGRESDVTPILETVTLSVTISMDVLATDQVTVENVTKTPTGKRASAKLDVQNVLVYQTTKVNIASTISDHVIQSVITQETLTTTHTHMPRTSVKDQLHQTVTGVFSTLDVIRLVNVYVMNITSETPVKNTVAHVKLYVRFAVS